MGVYVYTLSTADRQPRSARERTMSHCRLLAVAVFPLGVVGGVLSLSLRHMPVERGAAAGLCFIAGLGFAQGWIVASRIAQVRNSCTTLRSACSQGAQVRFKPVFLLGLCVLVGFLPMGVMGKPTEAPAQFATVIVGGVVFSTAGALITLPVLIAWMAG